MTVNITTSAPYEYKGDRKTIGEWVEECGRLAQDKGFDLGDTAKQLLLIHSEVSEATDVFRSRSLIGDEYERRLAEELADIVIRVFSFCYGNGIDLEHAIADKHAKNLNRPMKHGRDF